MKKIHYVLCGILLVVSLLPLPAARAGFSPAPATDYAREFVAACEGQQWFIDEVERLLNAEQKTLDTVASRADLAGIVSLGLRDRGITGSIPAAIGELTELRRLFLSGNRLGGTLPAALFTLPKLENIDLAGNAYGGAIPDGFGTMPALKHLNLKNNQFTGSIPASLLANTAVTFLDVSGNRLSGAVPAALNDMTGLRCLAISDNPWTAGALPDFSALTELNTLSAWNCRFIGALPDSLFTLNALQVLDLAENAFTGELPAAVGALTHLQLLSLGKNQLSGTLPDAFGTLTALTTLDISGNKLRGTLPASVGAIETVYAQGNYLTGDVLQGLAHNAHNFCDGAAAQYRLTASTPVTVSQTNRVNLYLLLKNTLSGAANKPLLPADCYIAAVSDDPEEKLTLTADESGIFVQAAVEEIKREEHISVTIRIKDNDGSALSQTKIEVTTERAAVSGGGGGGIGGSSEAPAPEPEAVSVRHEPYVTGYRDGTFQPDRSVAKEEVAAMLARVVGYDVTQPDDAPFPDVPTAQWSAASVAAAKRYDLVRGRGDGSFGLHDPMTRSEMVTMLVRLARSSGKEATAEARAFSDVPEGKWYYEYVTDAARYGLITGGTDGTFRPLDNVTRAEAVTMINRLLGRVFSASDVSGETSCPFSDVPENHWAYRQIMEASVGYTD